jgi:hypothetical protein
VFHKWNIAFFLTQCGARIRIKKRFFFAELLVCAKMVARALKNGLIGVYTKVQFNLPSLACYFLAPHTSLHIRKLHAPFGLQTINPTSAAAHASLMSSNRPSARIWPVLGARTSPYTFGLQGCGGSQLAAGRWPATCVQRPQLRYAIHALTGATASRQALDRGKQPSRELHLGQRTKNNVASGVRTAAALVAGNYSFPNFLFHLPLC